METLPHVITGASMMLIGFWMGWKLRGERFNCEEGTMHGLPDAPQSIKDIPMPKVKRPASPGVTKPSEMVPESTGCWVCCEGDGSSLWDALFPNTRSRR